MKTTGILGGMGPEATIYQYQLILKHTPANKDQDHIPVIIYSNPKIPDRTTAIIKGEHEKIIRELIRTAKLLEKAGANFIIIPCNTAHYYIEKMKESVSIPIFNMIEITANYISEKFKQMNNVPKDRRIGLLATDGTIQSEVYQKVFKNTNNEICIPKNVYQKEIMETIYTIKSRGYGQLNKGQINEILENIRMSEDIQWFLLGCTELPLLFQEEKSIEDLYLFDPMEIMAKHVIDYVLGIE